jgi:hypothetical protein
LETNGSVQQLQFLNYLDKYLWLVLYSLILFLEFTIYIKSFFSL